MRWLCLALCLNPLMAFADGLVTDQINLHDLLAISEPREWTGNKPNERVLLLLSDDETAGDLMTLITDPLTGEITSVEAKSAVLPAIAPGVDSGVYTLDYRTQENGVAGLVVHAVMSKFGSEVILERVPGGWQVTRATLRVRESGVSCRITLTDDGDYAERVLSGGQEIETATRSSMPPNWWQSGLTQTCWGP